MKKIINKKQLSLEIEIYFYVKYSSLTYEEISKKLKLKSSNACSQRYYRFIKKINKDESLKRILQILFANLQEKNNCHSGLDPESKLY